MVAKWRCGLSTCTRYPCGPGHGRRPRMAFGGGRLIGRLDVTVDGEAIGGERDVWLTMDIYSIDDDGVVVVYADRVSWLLLSMVLIVAILTHTHTHTHTYTHT